MFKKLAVFALFLAVTGLFAATSVNAQRLVKGSLVKSAPDTLLDEPAPEAQAAANLDQCHNGGVGEAPHDCTWENGNANQNQAHYAEGLNIHYRLRFSDLVVGTSYTITLANDAHKGPTNNAIDYLNTYDATITPPGSYAVDPCLGVVGCGAVDTFPIPDETCHTFDDATLGSRVFTGWGMDITGAQYISIGPAPTQEQCDVEERQFTVTFTATTTNPVLAWSGHIARAADWNSVGESSASSIQGSPYHMRIVANTGWGGQQDRALAQLAVITPSAAGANIAGRVTDSFGRSISGAKLTLTNAFTGEVEFAYTNTFGYYKFNDVTVNDFFVMSVQARRHLFVNGTISFTLQDNIDGMNFQASR